MLQRKRITIKSAEELAKHLDSVFSKRITPKALVLSVFEEEFLPQLAIQLQHICGRTFDPHQVTDDTTIEKLYEHLHG